MELGGGCSMASTKPPWFLCPPTHETAAEIPILHRSSCVHIWLWPRGPCPPEEAPGELVGSSRRSPLHAFQEVSPLPHRQQPLDPGAEPRVLRQELLGRLPARRAAGGAQRQEGPAARGGDARPSPRCRVGSDGRSRQRKRGGKGRPQLGRSPRQRAASVLPSPNPKARRVRAVRVPRRWTVYW